jgi:hypothetical protein
MEIAEEDAAPVRYIFFLAVVSDGAGTCGIKALGC